MSKCCELKDFPSCFFNWFMGLDGYITTFHQVLQVAIQPVCLIGIKTHHRIKTHKTCKSYLDIFCPRFQKFELWTRNIWAES